MVFSSTLVGTSNGAKRNEIPLFVYDDRSMNYCYWYLLVCISCYVSTVNCHLCQRIDRFIFIFSTRCAALTVPIQFIVHAGTDFILKLAHELSTRLHVPRAQPLAHIYGAIPWHLNALCACFTCALICVRTRVRISHRAHSIQGAMISSM